MRNAGPLPVSVAETAATWLADRKALLASRLAEIEEKAAIDALEEVRITGGKLRISDADPVAVLHVACAIHRGGEIRDRSGARQHCRIASINLLKDGMGVANVIIRKKVFPLYSATYRILRKLSKWPQRTRKASWIVQYLEDLWEETCFGAADEGVSVFEGTPSACSIFDRLHKKRLFTPSRKRLM